jgi:hypothetical protein
MKLYIINRAKLLYGAHATTMAINDYVNPRLSNYGGAIKQIDVVLVYPSRSSRAAAASDPFAVQLERLVQRAPRATFYRQQRRVELLQVCRGVSGTRISGNGHLNFDETTRLVKSASDGLELIRPRLQPQDEFDFDSFLDDARDALARCPKALKRLLE